MSTRLFDLLCGQCGGHVVLYRKEGSGNLLRLYLDRILAPEEISGLIQPLAKSKLPSLTCSECGQLIGVPMAHGKKNRPAFRLIKGAFRKKEKK